MKSFAKVSLAAAILLASAGTNATPTDPNMYMNLNGTSVGNVVDNPDYSDGITGLFDEFGFGQFLATSVYDITDGSLFGSFYDTNKASDLTALGIPRSGTAMDMTSTVSLATPSFAQIDIDKLSPLVPPIPFADNEGYLTEWQLLAEYTLNGTLGGTALDPTVTYTSGTIDFYIRDFSDGSGGISDPPDEHVLTLDLTSGAVALGNVDLFFDVTFAKDDFLFVETARDSGVFVDAADGLPLDPIHMKLDTNVNPVFPTLASLLPIDLNADENPDVAVRQTTLDGSIVAIPEPASVALLGLGLLGLSGMRRRRAS